MTVKSSGPVGGLIEGTSVAPQEGVSTPGYYSCEEMKNRGELTEGPAETTIPAENDTVENKYIVHQVIIAHPHVTLKHDCIITSPGDGTVKESGCGAGEAEYLKIEESDILGKSPKSNTAIGIFNECSTAHHSTPVLVKDALWNCVECINGSAETSETLIISNAEGEGVHTEDDYINGGVFTANKDTLLNPKAQTAIVFSNTCGPEVRITNGLIAGAGQMLQWCKEVTGAGGALEVVDNHFARCTNNISGTPKRCKSPKAWEEKAAAAGISVSGEEEGFFPFGQANEDELVGCGGVDCPGEASGGTFTWSGNVWDNNLAEVASQR